MARHGTGECSGVFCKRTAHLQTQQFGGIGRRACAMLTIARRSGLHSACGYRRDNAAKHDSVASNFFVGQ